VNLYVYYEVPASATGTARERIVRLFAAVAPNARLLKRADTKPDGRETWMEVHEGVDEAFEQSLDDAVARFGVTTLTGPRHVERFVAFD
jgi:Domain of unknown function (DUF4936)